MFRRSVRRRGSPSLATRSAGLALVAIGAVVPSVGCGGGTERDPADSALRVAIQQDGGPIHPYSGSASNLLGLVYDRLFEPSPYVAEPFPALAESAEQVDDLTWRVTLREGVRWHDGEPFTADDVVFTYRFYRDGPPNRYGHHVSDVPRIDEIVAEDARTVRFECGYPCPTLARITFADLPIIPEHVWRDVEAPREYGELPVGTGPYRLVEYLPDRLYRFVADPEYFLGAPRVERLVMPVIPGTVTALIALRTGEIDAAAHEVPPELEADLAGEPDIEVVRTSALSIVELRPNYRKPPFDEPRLRRALSLAVDRDRLVELVTLGQARPGSRGYPHPDSPWTDPDLSTPHDPAAAAAILDELGFVDADGDGVRERADVGALNLDFYVNAGEAGLVRASELLAVQLAEVGIAVAIETVETGALSQRVRSRDYDLFVSEIGAHGVADPDQFIMSHRSGYLWEPTTPYPQWDALFEEWTAATTVASRLAVSFRMQQLFNRQPTSIALWYPRHAFAFRPAAYDGWRESLGYGIVHKWSLVDAPD